MTHGLVAVTGRSYARAVEPRERQHLPVSTGVALSLVLAGVLLVLHLVNGLAVGGRLLDAGAENTIPTWFSSSQFLLAAVACLAAAGATLGRARGAWLLVAALALAFSLDEGASLHEEAGTRLGAQTTLSLTQPIAALVVVVLLVAAARSVRGRSAPLLITAAVVLVVSQACASLAGLFLDGAPRFLLESVEESTEVLTAITLLTAGLRGAGARVDLRPSALAGECRAWWRRPALSPRPRRSPDR